MKYDYDGLKQFLKHVYNKMINEDIKEVEVDLLELKKKFAPNSTCRLTSFKHYLRKILKDIVYMENLKLQVKIVGEKIKMSKG